jgi:hypothetical protein
VGATRRARRRCSSRGARGRYNLLIRGDDLGKSMSRYLIERVTDAENVGLLANT